MQNAVNASEKIIYEVFEEDEPTFVPSYIMSAFVLVGLTMLLRSDLPLWPPQAAHAFFLFWFGCLFVWMIRNSGGRTTFSSFRLTVTNEAYRHTFRYAIAEKPHVEIPIQEIEVVKITRGDRPTIEVNGADDADIYFLPRNADIDGLIKALKSVNPSIRVIEG
jgi:hypothetical protein